MSLLQPNRIPFKDTHELEKSIRAKLKEATITWKAFEPKANTVPKTSAEWTNVLLNIVLDIGREDFSWEVWPHHYYLNAATSRNMHYDDKKNSDNRGEWQFDACWTRYSELTKWVTELRAWNPHSQDCPPAGIELACESEWSGKRGANKRVSAVLDDFAKLVESRARFKLMFFDYLRRDGVGSFDDIRQLCEKLIATDTSGGRYLLMAWPSDAVWTDRLDATLLCAHLSAPLVSELKI